MWRQNGSWGVERRHWCHLIGLDCLFQKLLSTPKNKPFIQEMHLKTPLLSRGLKLFSSKPGCRVSDLHILLNKFHQWPYDIELNQMSDFLASYSRINPCSISGKRFVGLKPSRNSLTTENDHLHIYSLCTKVIIRSCWPMKRFLKFEMKFNPQSSIFLIPVCSSRAARTRCLCKLWTCARVQAGSFLTTRRMPPWSVCSYQAWWTSNLKDSVRAFASTARRFSFLMKLRTWTVVSAPGMTWEASFLSPFPRWVRLINEERII